MKLFFLLFSFLSMVHYLFSMELTRDQKIDFVKSVREVATYNIKYAQSFTIPGTTTPVKFDCSGTAQYLFEKGFGKKIPRSSLAQYLEIKNNNDYFETPLTADGKIDNDKLKKDLKTGDLLFWENTYDVGNRQPPISHVMIYMGKTKSGIMKAAGANVTQVGEKTKDGGVDIFVFDPNEFMGGINCQKKEKGKRKVCEIEGRFVGYGRFRD